jgi:hypothetical protein
MIFLRNLVANKTLNLVLLGALVASIGFFRFFYSDWCVNKSIYCNYKFYGGVYEPLVNGGVVLSVILALLLFTPAHIFRKWLFFIAPVFVALTVWQVLDISVYAGGMLVVTRTQMAQIGMIALGAATLIFVLGHLFYDWRKKKLVQE